ncbi:hypothetical protein ANASTE_02223 [Anaerofustis stercorihominis DSM 17244]|uniref:Uncharacterized protein n=1 Tax=Anaerofustis stercorihominis DSM 17244 TaxID=445971 RepID=B1CAM8_9FIRM|nr:hypothetical protein ANASTE_02223 [Anaerofustis stercorihominis DSM 17244]
MLFFFKIKKNEKISAQASEAEAVAKRYAKPTFANHFCGILFSSE